MKLIFPYDNDNIYTGTPVELYPDSETGDYLMPANGLSAGNKRRRHVAPIF
ncbi:hypothetical protein MK616_06630 [Bacillus amyloliquefaciens]|nr:MULTISPECIES: hypothetical protein [Bacillus amyloliquefaciens group]UMR27561.1 hypothetical protein MK616_06630 [Bacillus amyloliquefaciens]